jgi:hypothetical protein
VLPGDKATTSEISAEGSGGQIKKNSVKGLRKAALAFQKAALEMNKAEGDKHYYSPNDGKFGDCRHCGEGIYHERHDMPGTSRPNPGVKEKKGHYEVVSETQKAEPPMAKPPSGQSPGKLPVSKPQAPKAPAMGKIALPDAVPGEPAKLKKPLRAGLMSAKDAKESVTKGDFGMTDSGKASTLPAAPVQAAPAKPQYTAENLKADKAKMLNANVKPNRPGIFGKLQKKSK